MLEASSSNYLLLITDGCGFLYVSASAAAFLPKGLSCRALEDYVVPSLLFYLLFLQCFTGEVLWGVYAPDASSVAELLAERVRARRYLHVAAEEE